MCYVNYKTNVIYVIFVLIIMILWARADDFTTITELKTLIPTHEKVIQELSLYINQEKKILKHLKRYLRRLKVSKRRIDTSSTFLKNPINVMVLIKRLTVDYDAMVRWKYKTIRYYRNTTFIYPSLIDFESAVMNVALLVEFYNLNVTHLVRGKLSGIYSKTKQQYTERFAPLTSNDCYEIGEVLMINKEYDNALNWNLEALDMFSYLKKDHKTYGFRLEDVVELIGECFTSQGNFTDGLKWNKMTKNTKAMDWLRKNKRQVLARMRYRSAKKKKGFMIEEKELINIGIERKQLVENLTFPLFKSLCRGELDISKNVAKKLTCSYVCGPHPYLRLARIKIEQLFLEPSVTLLYDVVSDSEIQHIIELAAPNFKSSSIGSRKPGTYRVSTTAWLKDEESPVVERLSRRVGHLTGLNVSYSELLQVLEYGPGGRYMPHYDWATTVPLKTNCSNGRLTTVMFFLSEPTQGGATVFPGLGLTVYPEKGAALIWTNLQHTGEIDWETLHAGCPVLIGSKWVAVKWIRAIGQELVQPCPANPSSSYQPNNSHCWR